MVSSRFKHPKFADKPDIASANRRQLFAENIIGRHARFGKRIALHQAGTVPGTSKEKALLPKIQGQIHLTMQQRGVAASVKLERLVSTQRVLQESLKLRKQNGGRDPQIYQVLGKISLTFGLNSKELRGAATAMSTLWTWHKDWTTWDGAPTQVYNALRMKIGSERKNLPSSIEDFLHKQKTALTSKEIAAGLGIDYHKNINPLNSSMQLLETTMLAKKMPLILEIGTNTQLSVWAHRAYKPKIVKYQFNVEGKTHFKNIQIEILHQLLNNGSCTMTNLYREYALKDGGKIGNPKAIYWSLAVIKNAKLLEESGLIKMELIPTVTEDYAAGHLKGTGTSKLELTPLGKRLWGQAIQTGELSEELRLLLLGEKTVARLATFVGTPSPSLLLTTCYYSYIFK